MSSLRTVGGRSRSPASRPVGQVHRGPARPGPGPGPGRAAYELLTRPGVGVRLVAVNPGGTEPLWTGIADTFEHDLLTGEGKLEASDRVALFTGVDVSGWVRPAESGGRYGCGVPGGHAEPDPTDVHRDPRALSGAQFSGDLWSAVVTPTAEAEQSIMWVDQLGTLRRSNQFSRPAAVAAIDCDDGTSPIIYTRLTSLVEEERVVNMVIVERLNLPAGLRSRAPLKFSDNGSVAQLGAHALTETRLPLPNDDALRLWGLDVLEQRAGSQPSLSGLGVTIADVFPWVARTVAAVASLSVGSRLNVSLSSRGDPGFWAVAVAGIRHTIVPDSWEVELDVAQAPPTSELGASQQAVEVMAWA